MSIPKAANSLGPRTQGSVPTQPAVAPVSVAGSFVGVNESKLTIKIDAELHRRFKAAVATNGQKMREVLEKMIEDWTDAQSPGR